MSGPIDKKRLKPLSNAARERSRVQSLRTAFLDLQRSLPSVPPDTKLSKLDTLVLATAYIYHLTQTLEGHSHSDGLCPSRSGDNSTSTTDALLTTNYGCDKTYIYSNTHKHRRATGTATNTTTTTSTTTPTPNNTSITHTDDNDFNFKIASEIPPTHPQHVLQYSGYSKPTHIIQSTTSTASSYGLDNNNTQTTILNGDSNNVCLMKRNRQPNFLNDETIPAYSDSDASLSLDLEEDTRRDVLGRSSTTCSGTSTSTYPRDYSSSMMWTDKPRDRMRRLRPKLLSNRDGAVGILHPVKKWPMRYRLYDKILGHEPTVSRLGLWTRQEH